MVKRSGTTSRTGEALVVAALHRGASPAIVLAVASLAMGRRGRRVVEGATAPGRTLESARRRSRNIIRTVLGGGRRRGRDGHAFRATGGLGRRGAGLPAYSCHPMSLFFCFAGLIFVDHRVH